MRVTCVVTSASTRRYLRFYHELLLAVVLLLPPRAISRRVYLADSSRCASPDRGDDDERKEPRCVRALGCRRSRPGGVDKLEKYASRATATARWDIGRVVAIASHPRESISPARPDDLSPISSLARHVYTSSRALPPPPPPPSAFVPRCLSSRTLPPLSRLTLASPRFFIFLHLDWVPFVWCAGFSPASRRECARPCSRACLCLRMHVCMPRALLRGCVGRVNSGGSAGQNGRG